MMFKKGFFCHFNIRYLLILASVFIVFCISAFNWDVNLTGKSAYLENGNLANKSDTGGSSNNNNGGSIKIKEKEPREVIVVIDPGHGGEDWGTYKGDLREKDLNLDVSLRLGTLLKEAGIKVVYTREKDESVDLTKRSEIANDLNAALFISIHHNKMPDNSSYKGTETLYCPSQQADLDKMDGEKFAKIVQEELVGKLKTVDNGIIYRPNLSVLHRTKMPAVIAEIGYISNPSERERIASSLFRQKAAEALDNAILKVLEQMKAYRDAEGKWMFVDG